MDNPDGPDHDFFRALADEISATRITDLGCGTGILTVTLVREGREVTGIDPAPAMLDYAKHRAGAEKVHWLRGTADKIGPDSADLVLMTGNVAMHILGDEWHETLQAIVRGLRPGGRVVFEGRNPQAKAWEQWSADESDRSTSAGPLRESVMLEGPNEQGVVVMHCRTEFLDDRYVVDVDQALQFRSHHQIVNDLHRAGLELEAVYRNWTRDGFTGGSGQPLMVFEASHT